MYRLYFVFMISLLFMLSIPLFAAQTIPIAVMDLKPGGIPKLVSRAASDVIRSEFVNIANFEVAERSQISKIVGEQGLQMTGITTGNGVKVGRLLAVKKIVIGELTAIGTAAPKYTLTLRIVDVESGVAEYSERGTVNAIDEIESMSVKVADRLAGRIVRKYKTYFTSRTRSSYYMRGFVPGLGQVYADHDTKGYALLGLFVLSAGFSGYSYYDYRQKKDDYNGLGLGTPQATFDAKYSAYQDAGDKLTYSLIGMGAVYILNWIDILFFSTPDFNNNGRSSMQTGSMFLDFDYRGPLAGSLKNPGQKLINTNTGTVKKNTEHYYQIGIGFRF